MNAFVRCLAAAGVTTVLSLSLAASALAADPAGPCKPLSPVQARVVEKADQGVDALRDYVYVTRGIHALDMTDVAVSLDGWRASAKCAKLAAEQAAASQPVALRTSR